MDKRIEDIIQLQQQNLAVEAKNAYIKLLEENLSENDFHIAYINLGSIYFLEKNYEKARAYYTKSLDYNPKNEKAFYNIAMTFLQTEKLEESKEYFLKAIDINSRYLNAYINLGIVNKRLELIEEAIFCFETALDINPNEADVHYNYANIFLKNEQFYTALIYFKKALELNSKDAHKIYYSMGFVYQNKNEFDTAMQYYKKSLEYKKDYPDAHFARGTINLLRGDFENGWKEYEYRWDSNNELKRPDYIVKWLQTPQEAISKKILVQQEQGYGDNIQFVRYIYKLLELNAEVYLAVREPLFKLFSTIPKIHLLQNSDIFEDIDEANSESIRKQYRFF